MKKIRFFVFLVMFFIFLLQKTFAAKEFSVGVSPSLIELDEVYPGSSKPVSFFVITVSDQSFLVYLESLEPFIDFFDNPKYKININNYSQEPTTDWVQLFSNPVELNPKGEVSPLGETIKGWREINFLLNVPKDAEPGYHLLRISPKPVSSTDRVGPVVVQIASITPVTIFFKVPGDAIRQGKILDVTTGGQRGNNLEILIHFINTGTVTISTRANNIKIFDKNGNLTASLTSDTKLVKPKEKQILTALLPLNGLKEGEYFVSSNVNFITGYVQKNSTIRIYPKAVIVPTGVVTKPFEIPLWVLILIAFVIIFIIYRRIHESD
jgi:hypothetical protein